ncbi:hypothetical protein [Larkinella rosea]|uniref:Alpha-galactosidase n=1 Tax=Larkinella rosea TaxID=2025312 RepID=A0A3P1BJI8_9BACT|nr:hypothetical protein [Larkinella rosea]RRB01218.1 hypothetical protein EHT25_23890 [Larkinella rosea]
MPFLNPAFKTYSNRSGFLCLSFFLLHFTVLRAETVFSVQSGGYRFSWDLAKDSAVLTKEKPVAMLWKGSLLPAFSLQTASGENQYVKATVSDAASLRGDGGSVQLAFGTVGTGVLELDYSQGIFRIRKLTVNWKGDVPKLISMHFGTSPLKTAEKNRAPSPEQPFWPDWEAAGVCIPSAKGNPIQSFFRMWDFGQATLPLGSFGPSLGTPYAAAYPRPIYSCAMGNDPGWLVLGAGSIPDAAMVFQIQSSNGSLQYLYREDLWNKPAGSQRVWTEPLRIAWSATAYDAYEAYFNSFGPFTPVSETHQLNVWNTWGDFKNRDFNLKAITDKALDFKADVLAIDDSWESSQGSGLWFEQRFPNYRADLDYARSKGLKTGYWQNVVWIDKPEQFGLTADDLLCGTDGQPVKTSWNMNPHGSGNYCLDPSSAKAVALIQNRTRKIVRELKPDLLKLDFGYGVPSPNLATARNPAFRGEKLAYTLIKLIADAAREINPTITVQYYSIHPLFRDIQNLLALDDLGDAGGREAEGHGQWSIWSSLAGRQGMAIMASSGYDWNADDEVLLNTAIIGSQGAVLPRKLNDGSAVPARKISRRVALARWHRRSVGWTPLWLNSPKGDFLQEPKPNCWGRLENNRLTALALRESSVPFDRSLIRNIQFRGRWAIISQDDQSIFDAKKVALVPFDGGFVEMPFGKAPSKVVAVFNKEEKPFKLWEWKAGKLRIDAHSLQSNPSLNGFLVYK